MEDIKGRSEGSAVFSRLLLHIRHDATLIARVRNNDLLCFDHYLQRCAPMQPGVILRR